MDCTLSMITLCILVKLWQAICCLTKLNWIIALIMIMISCRIVIIFSWKNLLSLLVLCGLLMSLNLFLPNIALTIDYFSLLILDILKIGKTLKIVWTLFSVPIFLFWLHHLHHHHLQHHHQCHHLIYMKLNLKFCYTNNEMRSILLEEEILMKMTSCAVILVLYRHCQNCFRWLIEMLALFTTVFEGPLVREWSFTARCSLTGFDLTHLTTKWNCSRNKIVPLQKQLLTTNTHLLLFLNCHVDMFLGYNIFWCINGILVLFELIVKISMEHTCSMIVSHTSFNWILKSFMITKVWKNYIFPMKICNIHHVKYPLYLIGLMSLKAFKDSPTALL